MRTLTTRSLVPELMDDPNMPESLAQIFHRDLRRIHRVVGNASNVIKRLRKGPPAKRVLDIGCGDGALLARIRAEFGSQVTGVDLRPIVADPYDVPIFRADATRDPLPAAEVAVSMVVLHHLSEDEIVRLIRNVGRSCRRFVCLDLVRHPLPMVLFSVFVCPLVHREAAVDGRQSIRRAYTPTELRAIVQTALAGTGASFVHEVSPYRAHQVIDITYA